MTPERLQEIEHRATEFYSDDCTGGVPISAAIDDVWDLLAHIDTLTAERDAARRGQGGAHDAPPTTGRLRETHPIPDSRSDT